MRVRRWPPASRSLASSATITRGPESSPSATASWRTTRSTRSSSNRRSTSSMIGSPSGCHAEQARTAALAGCHVLVEKPLDISTARIDKLLHKVERTGVTLGVFFQDRLKPDVVAMKRRIDAGELGTPLRRHRRSEMVPPAGVLRRLALARHMGARRRRRADEPGHSHRRSAAAPARTGDARVGRDRDAVSQDRSRGHRDGDAGVRKRRAGNDRRDDRRVARPAAPAPGRRQRRIARARRRSPSGRGRHIRRERLVAGRDRCLRARADHRGLCRRRSQPARPPMCDGREGRRSVEVVEAVYRSAREKRAIDLRPNNR